MAYEEVIYINPNCSDAYKFKGFLNLILMVYILSNWELS